MAQKTDIRALFIQMFIGELIRNTSSSPINFSKSTQHIETPKNMQIIPRESEKRFPQQEQKLHPSSYHLNTPDALKPIHPTSLLRPIQVRPRLSMQRHGLPTRTRHPHTLNHSTFEGLDLGKLSALISEPRIQQIECPGENKELLIKKNDVIQKTSVSLAKSEIKKIVSEFSKATRIPVVGGVFKVAFKNLIMTAIISDFVGTRFVIQKKHPSHS
jgi:hypothetical protein